MKHQQIQLASKRNVIRLVALVAMLAVMVCGMVISINATGGAESTPNDVVFKDGYWVKTYDGTVDVDENDIQILGEDGNLIQIKKAEFNNANVAEATHITVTCNDDTTMEIPARIEPKELKWETGVKGTASVDYNSSGVYEVDTKDVTISSDALDISGVVNGETVEFKLTEAPATNENPDPAEIHFVTNTTGSVITYANVTLTGDYAANYTIAPLPVEVAIVVTKIEITEIEWEAPNSFTYGDDPSNVKAFGKFGEEKVQMLVTVKETENGYAFEAKVPNDFYEVKSGVTTTKAINIKNEYNVVFNGAEFLDKGETLNAGFGYQLIVEGANGEDLPKEVLNAIQYEYSKDGVTVTGVITEPGVYTVKAKLPAEVEIQGKKVSLVFNENATELTATMTVVRNYIVVSTPDGSIVIVGEGRISNSVNATLTIPTEFAKKALRGVKEYKGYTLTITGAEAGQKFSIYLPVAADLVANKNFEGMSVESLYLYNATEGTKAAAKDSYTVTLSEDGSYYIIAGYAPAGETTFMLAPDYKVPFWTSAIGIALIVLIALLLIVVLPIFIGMKLVQLENSGRNPVIAVETDGNVPEIEPVIIPDLIEDPDAVLEEGVEALAESLADEVVLEEAEIDVDATDAVAEAMEVLDAEVAEIDLGNADGALDEMVDQLALDLAEQIVAESTDADVSDEVKQAVADAMAENFNESADATDAIALVEDEEVVEEPVEEVVEEVVEEATEEAVVEEVAPEVVEEPVAPEVVAEPAPETEESEDDEEESFGGFGSMPLDYIDAIAEAERYAEMLEQESRGEVQLVTRYRRSYLSRLAQSQGSIQDYYNVIKNLLLSYKGVKSRISWNFESFNVGRTPLAKFNAKTRTLYVYIAFSPEELAETKYNFTDMSAKKKYAAVPVLLKVKGERKFKHALELITKLCEEKLQLPKKKTFTETDYRMPFKTTEELVQEGIVKMMVAAIPVAVPAVEEAVVEEAPVEETVVTEEVAAEEAVAEEAVAEEAVAEEAVAEEAVAEEAVAEEAVAEEAVAEEAVAEEAVAEEAVAEEAVAEEAVAEEAVAEETAPETNENA